MKVGKMMTNEFIEELTNDLLKERVMQVGKQGVFPKITYARCAAGDYEITSTNGISKRDFFAGMALSGMAKQRDHSIETYEDTADRALAYADALLKALCRPMSDEK